MNFGQMRLDNVNEATSRFKSVLWFNLFAAFVAFFGVATMFMFLFQIAALALIFSIPCIFAAGWEVIDAKYEYNRLVAKRHSEEE